MYERSLKSGSVPQAVLTIPQMKTPTAKRQTRRDFIGSNPFSLFGGVGAVWTKTREAAGLIRFSAKHPTLGTKTVEIRVKRMPQTAMI